MIDNSASSQKKKSISGKGGKKKRNNANSAHAVLVLAARVPLPLEEKIPMIPKTK